MRKIILLMVLAALVIQAKAQVRDISVTFSPSANFSWFNDQAGLENHMGFGANVGFGFGEFVELRANFIQLKDIPTSFENYGLANFDADLFQSQDVDLKRMGAEIKTNLGSKVLAPYLLFGTGVQTIQVAELDSKKQIYSDLGAGLKLNFGHRTAFTIEARNTAFKFNAVEELLTDQNKTDFGIVDDDYAVERFGNWSFNTSLQFYLGGTSPDEMSDLDRAYRSYYQHGFTGSRWVIEPAVSHIKFDEQSDFKNTYLLGAYTGIDFNEYVGIRAFYFRATNDNTIDFGDDLFDGLGLYGAEFRAKFNTSMGVTPFVSVGGGYIDVNEDYVTRSGAENPGDLFASAGMGLNIPIGKKVELFGSAKFLLTAADDNTTIAGKDDILSHHQIDIGLKFSVGKQAESPAEALEREKAAVRASEQKTYEQKLDEMKLIYLEEIAELEGELDAANAAGDSLRASQIAADKQKAEATYNSLNNTPSDTVKAVTSSGEIMMRMTPEQFEAILKTLLEGLKEMKPEVEKIQEEADSTKLEKQSMLIEKLNNRIDSLERNVGQMNAQPTAMQTSTAGVMSVESAEVGTQSAVSDETLRRLEELQKNYEDLSNDLKLMDTKMDMQAQMAQSPTVINTGQGQQDTQEPVVLTQTTNEDGTTEVHAVEVDELKDQTLDFAGISPMLGFNLGGAFSMNFTARAHMPIVGSKMELTPEFFYGLGSKSSIGVIGNVVYPISMKESKLKPYGGAGIGIWKIDGKSNLGLNLLGGTYLDLLGGKAFADLSLRSLKHWQFSMGYTFEF
ncbi:hypothetical protein SLH46_06655 [Draconibacterium sp. IB214405]|uniref:hypothetical protein n=1 Tax=Draconibacterium sp. IB214405 TaxID=3097352 RepID=UPI002A0E190E|nr:hypothetical protein [Draconibacterium sp. IB214405]MDX8338854.1 hypothetical protein [Draconibacterium sp. IB214405]